MPSPASTGPNLNSYAERCVRSVKRGLPRLILFGEQSLRRAVSNFLEHFHQSSGQGQSALIPTGTTASATQATAVRRGERLGGLLKHYNRAA
jgi:putative transposase